MCDIGPEIPLKQRCSFPIVSHLGPSPNPGFGRVTADATTIQGEKQFRLIRQGFNDYDGFNPEHALTVVVNEEKLVALSAVENAPVNWVTLFRKDPHSAAEQFSSPTVLKTLAHACGVQIVDGAHRWYACTHARTHGRWYIHTHFWHCMRLGPNRNFVMNKPLQTAW